MRYHSFERCQQEGDGFGQIVEVAAPAAGELDLFKAKNGDKNQSRVTHC